MGDRRRAAHHDVFLECWRASCECRVCTETVAWRVDAKGVCGSQRRVRKSLAPFSQRFRPVRAVELFGCRDSLNGSGRPGLMRALGGPREMDPPRLSQRFGLAWVLVSRLSQRFGPAWTDELFGFGVPRLAGSAKQVKTGPLHQEYNLVILNVHNLLH